MLKMIEIKTISKGAELVSVKLDGFEKMHDGESFWNRLGYSTASTETEDMGCALCGLPFFKEELFPVQMADGSLEYFCPDCVGHIALWCHSCNEPYENDGKTPQLCPDCRKEYGIS